MKPVVDLFRHYHSNADINNHFMRLLGDYDYTKDHVFSGFYAFSKERVDSDVLPLIGEPFQFFLINEKFFFHYSTLTKNGTPYNYKELVDFNRMAKVFDWDDRMGCVTLGLYKYEGEFYSENVDAPNHSKF